MTKYTVLLTEFLDVVNEETSITTQDKNGTYYDLEHVIDELAKIWHLLEKDIKSKIALAYVNVFMDFEHNKVKYEKLCKKTVKKPLSTFLEVCENSNDEHIIYDYLNERFGISDMIEKSNINNCWHFKFLLDVSEIKQAFDFLNNLSFKHFDNIDEFLNQKIEYQEICEIH